MSVRRSRFFRRCKRVLWWLGFILLAFGAAVGIPIIIDPPPRDQAAESQDRSGSRRGSRRRRG
jgi:hypothetical protein